MDPSASLAAGEGAPLQQPLWTDAQYRQLMDLINGTNSVAEEQLFEYWRKQADKVVDWTSEERRQIIRKWFDPVEEWTDEERNMYTGSPNPSDNFDNNDQTAFLLDFWKERIKKPEKWTDEEAQALLRKYYGPESRWSQLERYMFCSDVDWYKETNSIFRLDPSDAKPTNAQKENLLHKLMPNYKVGGINEEAWICGWTDEDIKNIIKEDCLYLQSIDQLKMETVHQTPDMKLNQNSNKKDAKKMPKKAEKTKTVSKLSTDSLDSDEDVIPNAGNESHSAYVGTGWSEEKHSNLTFENVPTSSAEINDTTAEADEFQTVDKDMQWKFINEKFDSVQQQLKKCRDESTKLILHISMCSKLKK